MTDEPIPVTWGRSAFNVHTGCPECRNRIRDSVDQHRRLADLALASCHGQRAVLTVCQDSSESAGLDPFSAPSTYVAGLVGVTQPTATRHLNALADSGWLTPVQPPHHHRGGGPRWFRLSLPSRWEAEGWAQTRTPDGGTLLYRPTSVLSTDALKALISAGIEDAGYDPAGHVIFDERTGKYGIENGCEWWSVATVKPAEGTPGYGLPSREEQAFSEDAMLADVGGTLRSFDVSFSADGTLNVDPTDQYLEAASAAFGGVPSG